MAHKSSRLPLIGSLLLLGFLLLSSGGLANPGRPAAQAVDKTPEPSAEDGRVRAAALAAVQAEENVLAFVIFEVRVGQITFSNDGLSALAWLEFFDRESGAPVPTEPGLAVAIREADGWRVSLPSQAGWPAELQSLPDDLMSPAAKAGWIEQQIREQGPQDGAAYGGYLLPWPEGDQKFLTRSISHGVDGPMHYAFDFAQPGYPSDMFPVYAAKGGTVRWVVWSYPNGYMDPDCNHANYLVLEHTDTTPTTYSMYLHLAYESIPAELRVQGAAVHQGQFIAVADDTGCSSGNHLHFQVHTNPWSYWGASVDVLFSDVGINGGRPRTVAEAQAYPQHGSQGQDLYISGNPVWNESIPPFGQITSPQNGNTIQGSSIAVSGWAKDLQSGLSHYQLKALYDEAWHPIGPLQTDPYFTYNWDWCSAGVSDGVVSFALDIWDLQGNLAPIAGIRHAFKNFDCPAQPPACQPGPGQVALFSEPGYRGVCQALDTGDYAKSSQLLPSGAPASVLVGSQALITLYSQEDQAGRSETFAQDDRDLLENPIGRHQASSAIVLPAGQVPSAASLRWPAAGQAISTTGSLDLVWADGGGGLEYQAQLNELNGPTTLTSPWLSGTYWSPTMPAAGAYTWRVRARNNAGTGGWSAPRALSITAAPLPPAPLQPVPWSEGFESGAGDWLASGGWALTTEADLVLGGAQSFHIPLAGAGTQPRAGDLTSPPISISQAGLALRFWYRYQTEGPSTHWDQRWLQLSVDGGPFSNLLQLADDAPDTWLQSPIIDLGPYQGSTVRLRFHFSSLDEEANTGQGWAIDDLTISAQAATACPDPQEPNPDPSQAAAISYGSVSTAAICPPGDRDFYVFQGTAGDRIAVDIDAEALGSPLDAYLYLLDGDGSTVLAENDDEVLYVLHDPHLGALLPATGDYYLKVRAWNHPGAGGETFTYTMKLERDQADPNLALVSPGSGQAFNTSSILLEATATDAGSGIRNVAFYWHAGDWQSGQWELLLDDRDSSDGWGLDFDPTLYPEQSGAAFLARAYDWAGNQANAGAWELTFDRTAPVTSLDALAPTQGSTAFQVSWNASDNLSGLAGLDLEKQTDLSPWTAWQTGLDPDLTSLWFIGEPDKLYGFRMRGADLAGNIESFPAGAETSTLVLDCSALDAWEPDDLQAQANPLSVEIETQQHNFCELQDVDWLKIQSSAGEHYRIWAVASHPSTAVSITLFAPDGTTILASDQSPDFGELATLAWKAQADGWYLAKLQHVNGAVGGNDVSYRVWVQSGYRINLPLSTR